MTIKEWLETIGLGQHAESFEENAVGLDLLDDLTNDDLKDLGIVKLGERKILLKAIAARADQSAPDPPGNESLPQNTPAKTVGESEGERRQVSVIFADISGFTNLSNSLGAEETHTLLNRYFEIVDTIIVDHGGTVDKHIGDAVMGVFGAPVAHTNDPERALRAAEAIHAALPALGLEMGRALQAHIGIASGQVVASGTGSDAHRAYTVTGDTVNLASRLDDLAGPGETLVSAGIQTSTQDLAEFSDRGEISIKGFDQAIQVWALQGLFQGQGETRRGPLIGRRSELRQFEALIEECQKEKQGQAILLRGEPGIGKTRLMEEFSTIARAKGFSVHRGLILDFGVGKGQDAVRMLVRSLLNIPPGGGKAQRQEAAARAIEQDWLDQNDLHFLNDLLNLPQSLDLQTLYDAMEVTQRVQGKRRVVTHLLRARAREGPCMISIEDVHWADNLTLDQLTAISSAIDDLPVMPVMSSRLEGQTLEQDWLAAMRGCPLTIMELHPLRPNQALSFAQALGEEQVNDLEEIVRRAEGNPLFIEQMVRSLAVGNRAEMPDTIQGLVLARTDQLPQEDREALQAAAVIGQRFSLEALRAIMNSPTYQADRLLSYRLVRPVGDELLFAHALIQEGVYASLLKGRRSALHSAAADWFADHDLALKAAHLDRAEDPQRAKAYQEAAEAATRAYHYERAEDLVRRGIEVAEEDDDKIALSCAHGQLLHDTGRISESLDLFGRALALAEQNPENKAARCYPLFGLAMGYRVQDEQEAALRIGYLARLTASPKKPI